MESGSLDILMDDRWCGSHGIGRFAQEIMSRLPAVRGLGLDSSALHPLDPLRLHRILRRRRPDVYFSPGFNPPWRSPVPYVFCIHDLIHLDDPNESTAVKRAYYRSFVRPAIRRAHRVITVSDYSKQRLLEWSGAAAQSVVVAPNGVGEEFHTDGPAHEPGYEYLLFVGAHKPHKNIPRLIDAFVRSNLPCDVKLVLTGKAANDERAVIARHELGDRVIFAGPLDHATLVQYYRGATALLMPSLHEGFGLPALEAMACGTAVIGSTAGPIPELIGEAGTCVDPHDVDALAQAIRRVVDDDAYRRECEVVGVRRAAEYSWERTASIVHATLADAVG